MSRVRPRDDRGGRVRTGDADDVEAGFGQRDCERAANRARA
jgi:hypothetical protein